LSKAKDLGVGDARDIRRVAVFSNSHPGEALYVWRVAGPLAHAGVEILPGAIGGDLHLAAVEQADAVLIQRDFPGRRSDYRQAVDLARSRAIPVLLDLDDLLFELPPDHPDRQSHHYAPTLIPTLEALLEADLVLTSTEVLRRRLSRFNPNMVVFRNRLDETLWPDSPRRPAPDDRPLGIGYFGTTTHTPDVEILGPALRTVVDRYGERIAIQFYGCPPPRSLQGDPRVVWAAHAWMTYREYVALLREAPVDIGLAPLADTDFNRAKSEAKFLEYSAAGLPGVYSDVEPYGAAIRPGRTGWLARSERDWVDHLSRLIEDGSLRERMAEAAFRDVHSRLTLSACRKDWRVTVERALRARRPAAAEQVERGELIRNLARQVAAWTDSLETEAGARRAEAERQVRESESNKQKLHLAEGQLQATQAEHAREIRALQDALNAQRLVAQALAEKLDSQRAEREALGHALEDLRVEREALRRAVGDLQAQSEALGHTIGTLREEVERGRQTLQQVQARLAERDDDLDALRLALSRARTPPSLARRLLRLAVHPFRASRLRRDIRVIAASQALDAAFYLLRYRDVRLSGGDPVRHYCEYGWKEGRDPSPAFDTRFYLEAHRDVAAVGINPLVHYLQYGRREGRVTRREGQPPAGWADQSQMTPDTPKVARTTLLGRLLSRAAIGVCTLPATLVFYDGFGAWVRAVRGGKSFVTDVLDNPVACRARLTKSPRAVRLLVAVPLAAALRIRKNGGLFQSLRNTYLVLREEGAYGLRARLLERASDGPVPASFSEAVPSSEPNPSRILVMDWRIPMADVSAGERATVGILADLCALGYDVVFLPKTMDPAPEYEDQLRQLGVRVVTRAEGYVSSIQYLERQGHTFTVYYLIRVDVAEMVLTTIRRVAPRAKVLFHLPDVYFLRQRREAELRGAPELMAAAEAMRERELAIIRQADRTVIVSSAELPVLREFVPDAPISVFPVLYAPVVEGPAPFDSRKGVFFLGGYEHPPNVDAVIWFVQEIWPQVHEVLPEAVFHIVGSKAPQEILELGSQPGVHVDGFVKDLDGLLSEMRVGVAPLRYGAGIKGKVAVTLGAGIPCVCTASAAEGLGIEDGVHALLADDPEAFAQAVVQLYTQPEPWQRLSLAGRELVRQRFGAQANRAALLRVLDAARALPIALWAAHCQSLAPHRVPCLAAGDPVDVSVIIPVHNKWTYTRACLNAILEACAADDFLYEIILADDLSTDETSRAAKHFPGLRIVRTATNVGFLRNCNNAAGHARGTYLLLLNNDTVVLPGWLAALKARMDEDASAAIVGSKLLYPDGTIQEAGGILWNDATAHNFGRGRPRDAIECNYVREVDYISGASILIRRTFWDVVGGFDQRYQTAYCEDSDLAMAARARGMRVVYDPGSEVVHFEHQSYAEQAPSHDPALQQRNIARLLEKWREVLTQQHQAPTTAPHLGVSAAQRTPSPSARARRGQGRLNVLYFSPFPSHPGKHGNQTTIRHFGRLFQGMGHSVHFVLLESDLFTKDDVEDMCSSWDSLDLIPNSLPMVADGRPIPFDGWYVEGLGERIACLCAKYEIDLVFCSYVFQSRLLEFVPAHALKVIDTHDKMGNRYEMLWANGQPPEFFSCTPEEEGVYLRRADIVVARREEEARYFDTVAGRETAIVIPHLEEPHFVQRAFDGLRHVGIVGSANRINLAIIRDCLAAIDRRLRGESCPFILHVAGQVKDMVAGLPSEEAQVFRKPWVRMHGFVPDIARFYAEMDLIISPATMGTGINVKTVQAMAYGMPLLTTLVGSKGIATGDPMHSHRDLDVLAESLLSLIGRPEELKRLAALSRARYTTFYQEGLSTMQGMFAHPKLGTSAASKQLRPTQQRSSTAREGEIG